MLGLLARTEEAVEALMAPYRAALEAVENLREQLETLMEQEGSMLGKCIGCDAPLFEGDKGFRYTEGELACEDCASTWQEWKEEAEETLADEFADEEHKASAASLLKRCADHAASGGSLSDKWVWEL